MLLNLFSLTHGGIGPHVTVTEDYGQTVARHVYGVNGTGLAVWLIVVSLYLGVLMGRSGPHNGQTIGMRRLGIRVVAYNGSPLTGVSAIARVLVMAVMWMALVLPGLIDCMWPLWDAERRAFHDIICGTHVVRAPKPATTWTP